MSQIEDVRCRTIAWFMGGSPCQSSHSQNASYPRRPHSCSTARQKPPVLGVISPLWETQPCVSGDSGNFRRSDPVIWL